MMRSGAERDPDSRPSTPRTLSDGTVLRPLSADRAELEACVGVQRAVWGQGFADVASPQILRIVQSMGGVAAGAFGTDGGMLGFVFGITGIKRRRPLHWSHMLAVLPEARGRDLGYHLKLYQRQRLLPLGVETVEWTYDPLVSKNAHLNLVRLGARAVEYRRDYYGSGEDSALSAGLGTDRFVVEWRLEGEGVEAALARGASREAVQEIDSAVREAPVANVRLTPEGRAEPVVGDPPEAPILRVEVPIDIQEVRRASPETATLWRASTRRTFEAGFERGYEIETFYREIAREDPSLQRSFYVLRRGGR